MVRKYDALFILPATLKEDDLDKTLKAIEDLIANLDGTASDVDILGKRSFARPTKKLDAGYYVKMKIDMDPAKLDDFRARLKLNEGVFRAQILRADEKAAATPPAEAASAPDEEAANG